MSKFAVAITACLMALCLASCAVSEPAGESVSSPAADDSVSLPETAPDDAPGLAESLLDDPGRAKDDPSVVFSGADEAGLIPGFIENVKNKTAGRLTGYMYGDAAPFVYALEYGADAGMRLTTYARLPDMTINSYALTDIYDTRYFYQFAGDDMAFSIPRAAVPVAEPAESYETGADLTGTAMTAAAASETAVVLESALETNPVAMNRRGVVLTKELTERADAPQKFRAEADGAAGMDGESYYQVSIYLEGGELLSIWYINAETPGLAFLVSMVDGALIPVAYGDVSHVRV